MIGEKTLLQAFTRYVGTKSNSDDFADMDRNRCSPSGGVTGSRSQSYAPRCVVSDINRSNAVQCSTDRLLDLMYLVYEVCCKHLL